MSLINIDSFRDSKDVQINGQIYRLQLMTVQDYINQTVEQKLDRTNMDRFVSSAVSVLQERSDMSQEVLETLTLRQLSMLLQVLQGVDPRPSESAGDSGKK